MGLGFMVKMVEFAYAYIDEPEDFLGESHRIGVGLKLARTALLRRRGRRPLLRSVTGTRTESRTVRTSARRPRRTSTVSRTPMDARTLTMTGTASWM